MSYRAILRPSRPAPTAARAASLTGAAHRAVTGERAGRLPYSFKGERELKRLRPSPVVIAYPRLQSGNEREPGTVEVMQSVGVGGTGRRPYPAREASIGHMRAAAIREVTETR